HRCSSESVVGAEGRGPRRTPARQASVERSARDDVLDGQRLVHREAEVRVPAEGTEPVEVVNHRSDDRVDVLLDVLQESTVAEEVVVVGVRLATVVTRRRTGALADAVVLDEADTFELA